MIDFGGVIRWIFGGSDKSTPKYRLVPDVRGTYTLEKWDAALGDYLVKDVRVTREEAEVAISNLENRKTIYWKE